MIYRGGVFLTTVRKKVTFLSSFFDAV